MTEITNAIINFFQELFKGNDVLTIIVISLLPIIELRGAIPVAIKLHMTWYESLFFCWLGSSLVAPILMLLLMPLLRAMEKTKVFRSIAQALKSTFEGKAKKIKSKADAEASEKKAVWKKMLGVFAFVAVPLPLTGVWTGSAIAVFLGLSFWQALPAVLLGNLMAGIIMTVLTVCFKKYVDTILAVFFIIVLVVIVSYVISMIVKVVKNKRSNRVDAMTSSDADIVVDATCGDSSSIDTGTCVEAEETTSIATAGTADGEDGSSTTEQTGDARDADIGDRSESEQ